MFDPVKNTPDLLLHHFLEENVEALQGIIRSYVVRSGLVYGSAVQSMVLEILHEASLEALAHAETFVTIRQPRAWFLGIAVNMIKRKRRTLAQRSQREFLASELADIREAEGESDFFDRISGLAHPGPEKELEAREQVAEILALVSPEDQYLLRLAFLQDLDTSGLAQKLQVLPGTARVRLHRALQRLRIAWQRHIQQEQGREHHA